MNKKGVTLVELLGAIALFSMVLGLIASITFMILTQSNRVTQHSLANSKAILIKETLQTKLDQLSINETESCASANCYVFISNFEYLVEEGEIIKETFLEPKTLRIEINSTRLLINEVVFNTDSFTLSSASLMLDEKPDEFRLTLAFSLQNSDKTYPYQFSFTIPKIT